MASNDVFGYKRNPKPDGVFSSEDSMMTIGSLSMTSAPFLVQNWDIQYNQDVQELFEIGSNRLYWVKGRPEGRGSIGRIVGATPAQVPGSGFMPKEAYDICDGGATMIIKAIGGHCEGGSTGSSRPATMNKGVNLTLSGVVVTSIGYSMSVQDVRIMENFGFRFAHLQSTQQ